MAARRHRAPSNVAQASTAPRVPVMMQALRAATSTPSARPSARLIMVIRVLPRHRVDRCTATKHRVVRLVMPNPLPAIVRVLIAPGPVVPVRAVRAAESPP
jgi:hypothetical protein